MPNFKKKFELSPRLKQGVGRGYSRNYILKFGGIICLIAALGLVINAFRIIAKAPKDNANGQVLGETDDQTSNQSEQFIEYKVQKGDTLFNVSQKFNINWTTLATLNKLESPFTLKPGQILKVPK